MIFEETNLRGSYVVRLEPITDNRGWFARTFDKGEFATIGFGGEWVQMNHSFTKLTGSVRGMHFQLPPFKEVKLVRCIRGAVSDVIIDIRAGSPTFLQYVTIRLSANDRNMLYIPEGFAHGFQTLEDDSELIYHHSKTYEPGSEGGIRYDDPVVEIKWPLPVTVISDRDKNHPLLDLNFKGI